MLDDNQGISSTMKKQIYLLSLLLSFHFIHLSQEYAIVLSLDSSKFALQNIHQKVLTEFDNDSIHHNFLYDKIEMDPEYPYFKLYKNNKQGMVGVGIGIQLKTMFDEILRAPDNGFYLRKQKNWSKVDDKGNLVISKVAPLTVQNNLWIKPKYPLGELAAIYCEAYQSNGKKGLIIIGTLADTIPALYDSIEFSTVIYFQSKYVKVMNNNKWGLVDKNNKEKLPILFEEITYYDNEIAVTKMKNKYGMTAISNQIQLFPHIYREIRPHPRPNRYYQGE